MSVGQDKDRLAYLSVETLVQQVASGVLPWGSACCRLRFLDTLGFVGSYCRQLGERLSEDAVPVVRSRFRLLSRLGYEPCRERAAMRVNYSRAA